MTPKTRVLIVEDDRSHCEALATLLEYAGFVVLTAWDGEAALAAVAKSPPEVAIIDLGLPGMDGFELADRLRELAPVVLIAISGYPEDAERGHAVGFAHHLRKPFAVETLTQILRSLPGR